ncbi:MAG: 4-(cytidine 5'-diphospho)-2-C-methyl-D-erythritol kinase, partial [Actinomycetota bacterium]|nr:4-(cytidine 5'-diphospho)-2-C-methyl-D-erythritol kinase [Actinomycetota bacterium]
MPTIVVVTCGYRGAGVRVRVPAKINLHLGVGARRGDGYHDLMTVFHSVSLFDTVTATDAATTSLLVTGADAEAVPDGPENLAWRAADLLARNHRRRPAARLHVDKAIPISAGLAGGSADAAATLVACDALWGLHTPRAELVALAAELGSDVPFAMTGGTAIGTSRGEILSPLLGGHDPLWWVLALADGGLSTPAVYAEFDRRRAGDPAERDAGLKPPTPLLRALQGEEGNGVADELHNDLQDAALALRPALRDTLDAGVLLGAMAGVVSG